MKKLLSMLLAATMMLGLSACSSSSTSSDSTSSESTATDTTATDAAATSDGGYDGPEYTLSLGHVVADDTPLDVGAHQLADLVYEKSGGKITIEIYSNSALGDNRSVIESMQQGTVDMALPAVANLAAFTSGTSLLDLPFLFNDAEHAEAVLDSEIGQNMLDGLESSGLVGLTWWVQGWRELSTGNTAVYSPDDLDGMKLRIQDNEIHTAFWTELGASPTTLAFSELFTALQQNVVDAQENPMSNIKLSGFAEVQDYVIVTDHIYDALPLVMSKVTVDAMDPAALAIIEEAALEATEYQRNYTYQFDEDILAEYEAAGYPTVIRLTDEQRAVFVEAVQPVYEKYADSIGQDTIDAVLAMG